MSIKEVISLMHKVTFVRDTNKQREMILNLIAKSSLLEREKITNEELSALGKHLKESLEMFSPFSLICTSEQSPSSSKLQKLSSKKIINCTSMNIKNGIGITRRHTAQIGDLQHLR